MEICKTEYSIIKLAGVGYKSEKTRNKIAIRAVITGFFEQQDHVTIIDLKKLERTTEIKVVPISASGSVAIINSIFTNHINKYAVIQKIDFNQIPILVKEAGENEFNYNLDNYIIHTAENAVLLTVLNDDLIKSFTKTRQQTLI